MESLKSGRESREAIQGCVRTCAAVHRCIGSTWSIRRTRSLAEEDTESQLPPTRGILPSPILARICLGVSSGPVAKGVDLSRGKRKVHKTKQCSILEMIQKFRMELFLKGQLYLLPHNEQSIGKIIIPLLCILKKHSTPLQLYLMVR